ncbi:MAG: hypothetical protein CVU84_13190 [Firmicutes bacterium HGW-Firmicutes-1]|jgi:two-component system response regulator YesN|nr:MAG: hypothetical protein CVU84_13190 [Firmicutes bacterium HGW-Firmicutes-1]
MKYRLVVVDDEEIVINAVKFIVEKNMENVEIIGTAKNGREAIEAAIRLNPDIMLMDITMPGINGVDAIKEIIEHNSKIKFVILSAYEQFEYAKEAVGLGVQDYLLKPINRYKLIDALNEVIKTLEIEHSKRIKEIENMEKLQNVLPILEQGFIYSILMNRDYEDEISKYKELFELKEEGGYLLVIEFGEYDSSTLKNKIGSGVKLQKSYNLIRDSLKFKYKCLVGPAIINRIIVFVSKDHPSDEYEFRLETIEMAEYIAETAMKKTGVECYIGIGGYYHLKELPYSYEEALKALRDSNGQAVTHIKDVKNENRMELDVYNTIGKELLVAFESGNEEKTLVYLNKIYDAISCLPTHDQPNKCIEIMVLIYRKAYEMDVKSDTVINYSSYLEEIIGQDKEELQRWSIRKVKYFVSRISEMNKNKVSKAVLEAKNYIDIHYSKELTLEEISRVVSVSPQYFSKLFKEETGFNFIEYLTNSRIEKAKELIKNSQMTMKEVCFEVGYNDPNYFSRLFKKIVGVSPTDYLRK